MPPTRSRLPVSSGSTWARPHLGAHWNEIQQDDPAQAIADFARQHEITQILFGPIHRSWWHVAAGGPIVRRVIEEAGASGIDVLIIGRHGAPERATIAEALAPGGLGQGLPATNVRVHAGRLYRNNVAI